MNSEMGALYGIADWLWSFKWLAIALFLIGLAGAAFMWNAPITTSTSHEVHLDIFRSGTALRGADQISEILSTKISAPDSSLISRRGDNPVIFGVATVSAADEVISQADVIEAQLIDEVTEWRQEIGGLVVENPSAFSEFARIHAFLAGIDSKLIDLVQPQTKTVQTTSRRQPWDLPILLSIIAFFGLAVPWTFIRGWRRHRAMKHEA